jgi:hypothetical protein
MALSGISLDAASVVGPGASIVPDVPMRFPGMSVVATGNPNAQVVLEGTIDGVNWRTYFTVTLTSGGAQVAFASVVNSLGPSVAYRANLTSLSGGTSPTVTAHIAIA